MWRTDLLIDTAEAALRHREDDLAAEHAVHGLDACEETDIHPLLAEEFARAGFEVLREQPYPHEWRLKRGRRGKLADDVPERRDRLRCDLVLTPSPGQRLVDPLSVERVVTAHRREIQSTLFAPLAESETRRTEEAASEGIGPDEAYWLEIKVVGQFAYNADIPGPNHTYASELRRTAADLRKLDEDEQILDAGLLLVVFTADEATARHDLHALFHACLDRGLPIRAPEMRHIAIRERIGNHVCTLCLVGLNKPTALTSPEQSHG